LRALSGFVFAHLQDGDRDTVHPSFSSSIPQLHFENRSVYMGFLASFGSFDVCAASENQKRHRFCDGDLNYTSSLDFIPHFSS
jgi:hypothetical protein